MFAGKYLRPFIEFGDVSQCWLPVGHRAECAEANEAHRSLGFAAFVDWLAGNGQVS